MSLPSRNGQTVFMIVRLQGGCKQRMEILPFSFQGEGSTLSPKGNTLAKWSRPLCHYLRKQESSLIPPQTGTQAIRPSLIFRIPACAGMTTEIPLSRLRFALSRPLPRGIGERRGHLSFLRKQESRECHSCESGNPAGMTDRDRWKCYGKFFRGAIPHDPRLQGKGVSIK